MTNSIFSAKRRALLLSAATAGLVLSSALVANPALAADECGAPSGGAVTCTSAGNPYVNGITYSSVGAPLSLTADQTVQASGPIQVTTTGGAASINNSGTVSATQAALGGVAASASGGDATVVNAGNVTTSAAGTPGLYAASTGGVASITNSANVAATGTASNGVTAAGSAGNTIDNSGTITPGAGGFGIATSGGAATIANTGTVNGPVSLSSLGGNTFNNNAGGTWNATGTSVFSAAGTDVVNNDGRVVAASEAGATGPATIAFTNLAAFNNGVAGTGVVDVSTGNLLDIGTAVFNGTPAGGVAGSSQLWVNGASPSGALAVNGSTGNTWVVPIDVANGAPGIMNFTGQNVVFGATPGTFTMPGGAMDFRRGFIDYRLAFTPATSTATSVYTLFGLPGPEVFEALSVPYAAQDFWRHSADAWTQRQMELRDSQVGSSPSRPEGWEVWVVPYGGHDSFDRGGTFSFSGFTFPQIGTNTASFGIQAGADVLSHWGNGYGYWGFTAGLENQETGFIGDIENDIHAVGGNVGMYGGANWGGLYLNGLGKVDFVDLNANFNSANFSPMDLWMTWGGKGEIGYRWPMGGFFVEPAFRASGIWTDATDFHPAGASLRYDIDEPIVQLQGGGRVGTTLGFFGYQFTGYGGAFWADQVNGNNRMVFTTPGLTSALSPTSIGLVQPQTGSYIHIEYGLETGNFYGGLKGFLKGENDLAGDGYGAWTALMGFRFSF
jgi:hypothetical protein